jgi:hypothetical protein
MLMTLAVVLAYVVRDVRGDRRRVYGLHQQRQQQQAGSSPAGGRVVRVTALLDSLATDRRGMSLASTADREGRTHHFSRHAAGVSDHTRFAATGQPVPAQDVTSQQHTVTRRAMTATNLRGRQKSRGRGHSSTGRTDGHHYLAHSDGMAAAVRAARKSPRRSPTKRHPLKKKAIAAMRQHTISDTRNPSILFGEGHPLNKHLPAAKAQSRSSSEMPLAPGTEWRTADVRHSPTWKPYRVIEAKQQREGGCAHTGAEESSCPISGGCKQANGEETIFAVTTPRNDGFASLMLTLGWVMRRCLNMNHIFVVDPHKFGNYDATGTIYHKLFERETVCSEQRYAQVQPKGVMPNAYEMFLKSASDPLYGPPSQLEVDQMDRGEWEGHILRWLLRPTPLFTEQLEQTMMQIGYPARNAEEAVIGIHVRRGDKITTEHRQAVPAAQYIDAAIQLTRAARAAAALNSSVPVPSVIFVATDDKDYAHMFAEMRNTLRSASDLNLRLISQADQHIHQHSMAHYLKSLATGIPYQSAQQVAKASASDLLSISHRVTAEIASDLLLLAESDYFIGTASSSVAMAAVRLRFARYREAGMRPPHRAVKIDAYGDSTATRMWTTAFSPSSRFMPADFEAAPK